MKQLLEEKKKNGSPRMMKLNPKRIAMDSVIKEVD
jgi:hypothetical protein